MSGTFNGYHVWLGIPASEQPPNHYRLLGIAIFESDRDVIDHAADRQMAHVRTFQSGQHGALSQAILNELSAARGCLLNVERKAAYDEQLRATMSTVTPKAMPVGKAVPIAQPVLAQPVVTAPSAASARPGAAVPPGSRVSVRITPVAKVADAVDDDFGLTTPTIAPLAGNDDPDGMLGYDADDSMSGGAATFPVRGRRRFRGRNSAWQRPALLGILAALVVISFIGLIYLAKYLASPEFKTLLDSVLDSGPPAATAPPLAPSPGNQPAAPTPEADTPGEETPAS